MIDDVRYLAVTLAAVLSTLLLMVGFRTAMGFTTLGLDTSAEQCLPSPSGTPGHELCVRRVHRPELLVVPGAAEIEVRPVHDGAAAGGRYLVADDPFWRYDDIVATVTADGAVEVTTANGNLRLTFAADSVAGLPL